MRCSDPSGPQSVRVTKIVSIYAIISRHHSRNPSWRNENGDIPDRIRTRSATNRAARMPRDYRILSAVAVEKERGLDMVGHGWRPLVRIHSISCLRHQADSCGNHMLSQFDCIADVLHYRCVIGRSPLHGCSSAPPRSQYRRAEAHCIRGRRRQAARSKDRSGPKPPEIALENSLCAHAIDDPSPAAGRTSE